MSDPTPSAEERAARIIEAIKAEAPWIYVANQIREAEEAMEIRARQKAMKDASRLVALRCASSLQEGCGRCRLCYAAKELREEADRA